MKLHDSNALSVHDIFYIAIPVIFRYFSLFFAFIFLLIRLLLLIVKMDLVDESKFMIIYFEITSNLPFFVFFFVYKNLNYYII